MSIFTFTIMSMENISCHSNKSSYPTRIKIMIRVEANVLSMYAKFQLHPLMVSEKKIFNNFRNIAFTWPRQPIKSSDLDKSHMKCGGLLNKNVCEKNQMSPMRQQKLSVTIFYVYVK